MEGGAAVGDEGISGSPEMPERRCERPARRLVKLATDPGQRDARRVARQVPASRRPIKSAQPYPGRARLREIRRIERADRRWQVASERRRQAAGEKFAAAWTGNPDDLPFAELQAVAALPDRPPAGYAERRRVCIQCGSPPAYSVEHDANYCPKCRRWLERACSPGGSSCKYCGTRPKRPPVKTQN